MLRQGDTSWVAGFRIKILQALHQYHEVTLRGTCTATVDTVEEVWLHPAKAWSRMGPGGSQSRDLYDLALLQLQQQRRLELVGEQQQPLRRVRQCVQTAVARRGQARGAVGKQVTQAGRTPVTVRWRKMWSSTCAQDGSQCERQPRKRATGMWQWSCWQ